MAFDIRTRLARFGLRPFLARFGAGRRARPAVNDRIRARIPFS